MQCTQYVNLQCALTHSWHQLLIEHQTTRVQVQHTVSWSLAASFCAATTPAPFFPCPAIELQQQRQHCIKAKSRLAVTFDQGWFINSLTSAYIDENTALLHAVYGRSIDELVCGWGQWQRCNNIVALGHQSIQVIRSVYLNTTDVYIVLHDVVGSN